MIEFCKQPALFCRQKQKYTHYTGQSLAFSVVVMFSLAQISADPADINVLPEYSNDPRVVQNLLDGVNQTRDDLHMWLAPFSPGRPHTVSLTFTSPTTLALVRIWVSARTCDPNVSVISLVWIEVDFVALQYERLYQLFEELMMLYDASEWLVVLCSHQNYNKSRIHSYRGARLVEMYLDAEIIFRGEIAK